MSSDRRKFRRRHLERGAVLSAEDGSVIAECVVSDVSIGGACITIDESVKLPEKFKLLLSQIGNVHRNCLVAWRTKTQIGVKFFPDPPADIV